MSLTQTVLDHEGLPAKKAEHPEWIWNRSDNHVILAVPEAPEAYTTVVEPGNSYSPGFRSYGVSTWVSVDGELVAPELLPMDQLRWRWSRGFLPVLECEWEAGPLTIRSSLFTDGDPATRTIRTNLQLEVANDSAEPVEAVLHLAIRSFGATGAPIAKLEFAGRDVLIDDVVVATLADEPTSAGAVSFAESGEDVGEVLRSGRFPDAPHVVDPSTWASGVASFAVSLQPGETFSTAAQHFVQATHSHLDWLRRDRGLDFEPADRTAFEQAWLDRLPAHFDLPDPRFSDALQAQAVYLLMGSVGIEPRISPISYPLWWLRDGSYEITAMGKAGFTEWVDRAVRAIAPREPFGGFGAEGDGPGELIWLMTEHARMTGDDEFLRFAFPHIARNADLIVRMRNTTVPMFGKTDIRTPEMMFGPSADLMCRPAKDGLIQGRMDGHFPRFWVNGWAFFGLSRAIEAGKRLGEDTALWEEQLQEHKAAIDRMLPGNFGENERDVTGSIWPTGYIDPSDAAAREVFDRYWNTVRYPGGVHHPEPEWTYFECGQAHNNILLGHRDRAWVTIEHFLTNSTAPGLYTQHEGIGDENSSLQWQRSRGWDLTPHVTPHGWTAAEFFLLLRDSLLRETTDGALVIGSGIPASWLERDFSYTGLPSWFGAVDVRWDAAARRLTVTTERTVPGGIRHELPTDAPVDLAVEGLVAAH